MCRNIKTLFNFEPPATETDIRAASLQFVRKVSGSTKPSKANESAFEQAVDNMTASVTELLKALSTAALPKDREKETEKARAKSTERFGPRKVSQKT